MVNTIICEEYFRTSFSKDRAWLRIQIQLAPEGKIHSSGHCRSSRVVLVRGGHPIVLQKEPVSLLGSDVTRLRAQVTHICSRVKLAQIRIMEDGEVL